MGNREIRQRSGRGQRLRCVRRLAALAAVMLSSGGAWAQPAPTAPATSTGSYTVSYACGTCQHHWLEEKAGDGQWTYVGVGSVSFAGKPQGTYYYRVGVYYYDYYDWTFSGATYYGPQTVVSVSSYTRSLDTLEQQLTYRYEARRGDANGDGRADLFVNRTAGGTAGNGVLEKVILLQQSNGKFTSLVPSAAQLSAARDWPVSSTALDLRDVNADGFVDVVLRSVSSAVGVGGALNQIVYSPGRTFAQSPLGLRSIDASFAQFASNAYQYVADPQYFANNAPLSVQTVTAWEYWCTYGYGYGYDDYASLYPQCYWLPVQITTVAPDYSAFNSSALAIWTQESAIYGNTQTRAGGLNAIKATIEQMLTVPIGGWDLGGRRGEAGSLDEIDYRRGFEMFAALFNIGRAQGSEPPRASDTVYVTGRRIIGWLPFMHTALEYNRSTVSAYDSDDRTLGNGVLFSEKNWAGDFPHLMMTLGTASKAGTAPLAYWGQMLAADTRYDDHLPYSPVPRAGEGRFNSNGYVSGIVGATGGVTSINMGRYTGGNLPVPAWAFN